MAPISQLPNELLSEVFTFCKPRFLEQHRSTPLIRVCSRWREIALQTPHIWTTLEVVFFDDNHAELPRIVSTWIQRSYPLPIQFSAEFDSGRQVYTELGNNGKDHVLDVVVKEISDAVERWDVMELELPSEYARRIFLAITENGGTPCSKLGIMLKGKYPGEREEPAPFIALQDKMNLTSIRSLHIDSLINPDSGIRIIATCPNLQKLRFSFETSSMAYRGDRVLLQKLYSVHLLFHQNDVVRERQEDTPDIIHKITAPSLRALSLTGLSGTSLQLDSILDFINRSRCQLGWFHYDCRTSEDRVFGRVTEILKASPFIQFLSICILSEWSQLMRFVTTLRDTTLVPLLERCTLEMNEFSYEGCVMKQLRDFMVVRSWKKGGKLRKVTLLTGWVSDEPSEGGSFSDGLKGSGVSCALKYSNHRTRLCRWD